MHGPEHNSYKARAHDGKCLLASPNDRRQLEHESARNFRGLSRSSRSIPGSDTRAAYDNDLERYCLGKVTDEQELEGDFDLR